MDEGFFRENLSRITGIGLAGILVAGSTGEAPYLAESERLRLVEVAREIVKAPEILMVGTGLESTSATLRLSREAVARGADALLVLTPNYYKPRMDSAALVAHYRAVGAGVKRPVLIYSIPQFTGLEVDPATIAQLSRLPNVVGLKESSGKLDFVRAVLRKVRPGFRVMVGAVIHLLRRLVRWRGGSGAGPGQFCPVALRGPLPGVPPPACRRKRATCSNALLPLGQKINLPYGVAGIKAALDLCGYHGGTPRLPLLPVSAQAKKQIAAALREANAGLAV